MKFVDENGGDPCQEGESDWAKVVLLMADKHSVETKGPFGIEEAIESIDDGAEDPSDDSDEEMQEDDDAASKTWKT